MKSESTIKQEPMTSLGAGMWRVNTDEKIVTKDIMGKTKTFYQYNSLDFYFKPTYPDVVDGLIRERYSVSDELAIQRQKDTKPEDFAEYDEFCEQCKTTAREIFDEIDKNEETI